MNRNYASFKRTLLAVIPGALLLALLLLFLHLSYGEQSAGLTPERAGDLIAAASAAGEPGSDGGRIAVIVSYSTTPTGSLVERRMSFSSPQDLLALTPENVVGYHFYWMSDGQIWDRRALQEGVTYVGQWVPVYEITVY